MSKRLKVYCWNLDGRQQALIATTSWAKAVAAFHTKVGHAKAYGGITEEPVAVAVAMARPETRFTRSYRFGSQWQEVTP